MNETSVSSISTDWSIQSISIKSDLLIFIDLSIDKSIPIFIEWLLRVLSDSGEAPRNEGGSTREEKSKVFSPPQSLLFLPLIYVILLFRSPHVAMREEGRPLAVYCEAQLIMIIMIIVAIAEVYKNEGNDEYKKNNFNNAIQFYTEGIKVNCKDEELNAILYSNRAAARFNLGEKLLLVVLNILNFF